MELEQGVTDKEKEVAEKVAKLPKFCCKEEMDFREDDAGDFEEGKMYSWICRECGRVISVLDVKFNKETLEQYLEDNPLPGSGRK